jgi:hypothetical protein
MFEEVLGIPAHPLIIHGAVVFVPLQLLGAVVYAFLPGLRPRVGWAVMALAVVGPAAAWVARLSGQALEQRMIDNGVRDATVLGGINQHQDYGNKTAWAALALGVLTIVFIVLVRRSAPAPAGGPAVSTSSSGSVVVEWVLRVAVLALAGVTAYYVFKTGDTGSHLVWRSV